MDMQMPGMDGVEATRHIRELEADHDTQPRVFISALTANVLPVEKARCFEPAWMNTSPNRSIAALCRVLELASKRADEWKVEIENTGKPAPSLRENREAPALPALRGGATVLYSSGGSVSRSSAWSVVLSRRPEALKRCAFW